MKRTTIVTGTAALLLLSIGVCSAATPIQLLAPELEVGPGEEIHVPISFKDAPGIGAMEFDVCYDTSVLEAIDAELGPLGEGMMIDVNLDAPGYVILSMATARDGATGDGELLSVQFRVKGEAGTNTRLWFENVRAWRSSDEYDVAIQTVEGQVTVASAFPWLLIGAIGAVVLVLLLLLLAFMRKRGQPGQRPPGRAARPPVVAKAQKKAGGCPKCGAAVADGVKFCPECGQAQPARASAPGRGGGPLRSILIGAIVLVIVGIVGMGAYGLWPRTQRGEAESTPSGEQAAASQPAASDTPFREPVDPAPAPSVIRDPGLSSSAPPPFSFAAERPTPATTSGASAEVSDLRVEQAAEHGRRATEFFSEGKWSEAEAAYREAAELHPNNAAYHHNLASTLSELDRPTEAVEQSRRAVELDRNNALFHLGLGNALSLSEKYTDAANAYQEATAIDPKHAVAFGNLADALMRKGRLDEAAEMAEKMIALGTREHAVLIELADDFFQRSKKLDKTKHRETQHALEIATRLDPSQTEHWNNLGNVYYRMGRPREAEDAYREAIRQKSDNAVAYANLAGALLNQDRRDEALESAREAMRLGYKDHPNYKKLGLTPMVKGAGSVSKTIDPAAAGQHNVRGNALFDEGKWSESAAAYREAIRLNPDVGTYYGNLSAALVNLKEYAEAETVGRQGVQRSAKEVLIRDNLGNALYAQGKYEEAAAQYREAMQLDPKDGKYYANLAGALVKQGKRQEALEWARKAKSLGLEEHWVFKDLRLDSGGKAAGDTPVLDTRRPTASPTRERSNDLDELRHRDPPHGLGETPDSSFDPGPEFRRRK